jgi:hypothetical protein
MWRGMGDILRLQEGEVSGVLRNRADVDHRVVVDNWDENLDQRSLGEMEVYCLEGVIEGILENLHLANRVVLALQVENLF